MKPIRFVIPALLVLVVPAFSQQEYEVTVTQITVWVKAVDENGNPMKGLKQEDFSITERGLPVETTCFEEVEAGYQPDPELLQAGAEVPAKKFVVFLDLYNTTPVEYLEVRPFVQDFIRSLYGKNVQMMLAAVMANRKLGVVVPFTKDLNRIRLVLNQAMGNALRDINVERKFDELMRVFEGAVGDTLEDIVVQASHDIESLANQEQSEVLFSLGALQAFAEHLGNTELGEQVVILYVSGGFSAEPGRRYYDVIDRIAERRLNNAAVQFYSQRRSRFNFRKEMEKSVGSLNRSNVTVYTINTRGHSFRKENQDSLIEISRETGGLAFYNSKNFDVAFNQVLQDISHQYVLCYTPPPHEKSREYNEIRVQTQKPGVKLRHRQGYFE